MRVSRIRVERGKGGGEKRKKWILVSPHFTPALDVAVVAPCENAKERTKE